jgi:hypothetical protein
MLIVRRLKGLAGDLGPSPLHRDVYARATREPFQVFFVSHSSVLRRFGKQMFLLHSADGWPIVLALSTPMLVVSFAPAATSSLIRDVQEVTSANVFHCFRVHCIASSAG